LRFSNIFGQTYVLCKESIANSRSRVFKAVAERSGGHFYTSFVKQKPPPQESLFSCGGGGESFSKQSIIASKRVDSLSLCFIWPTYVPPVAEVATIYGVFVAKMPCVSPRSAFVLVSDFGCTRPPA